VKSISYQNFAIDSLLVSPATD